MGNSNKYKRQVKEGIDNLPTGLIFAKTNGVIILANKKMYDIYNVIIGEIPQNCYVFWEKLYEENEHIKVLDKSKKPIIVIDDTLVYTFSMDKFYLNGQELVQIKATDITELNKVSVDLIEKNKKIKEIREKIINMKNNLENITREEEMIDAKLKIHRSMGTTLASIRRFLIDEEGDLNKALKTWRKSIELLNKDEEFFETDEFDSLINASNSVGIELEIKGAFPDAKFNKAIMWTARECLINAAVHGSANKMLIEFSESLDAYHVSFSNNGLKPNKEIKEGGGFMAIRKVLSEVNGDFEIHLQDDFLLRLNLPKWEYRL